MVEVLKFMEDEIYRRVKEALPNRSCTNVIVMNKTTHTLEYQAEMKKNRQGKYICSTKVYRGTNLWGDRRYRSQIVPSKLKSFVKEVVKAAEGKYNLHITPTFLQSTTTQYNKEILIIDVHFSFKKGEVKK